MLIALAACTRNDGDHPVVYDTRAPVGDALEAALVELPDVRPGIVIVGEDHRSRVAPMVAGMLLQQLGADCLFLELWPDHQPALDAFAARRTEGACLEWAPNEECKPLQRSDIALLRGARNVGAEVWAVDTLGPDLALELSPWKGRSLKDLPDELWAAVLGERNVAMANSMAALWSEGCDIAVMVAGAAHLKRDRRGGAAPLTEQLELLGVPATGLVVREPDPVGHLPLHTRAQLASPSRKSPNWVLRLDFVGAATVDRGKQR